MSSYDLVNKVFEQSPVEELRDFIGSLISRHFGRITLLAIIGALISMGPLFLLYQQNSLIRSQIGKVEQQTELLQPQTIASKLAQTRELQKDA